MKKAIGILLAGVLSASAVITSFGSTLGNYTPQDVLDNLEAGEELAADVDEQALNGVCRLTEMIAGICLTNADEDQLANLTQNINDLNEELADESLETESKLGFAACELVNVLETLAREFDTDGSHAADIDGIRSAFDEEGAAITTGDEQYVNALRYSVFMAAYCTVCSCSTQEEAAQIAAGIEEFNTDWANAEGDARKQVASRWLYKMIGAMVKLQVPDNASAIDTITESTEALVEEAQGPKQASVNWLYSAVRAASGLTGTLTV